MIRNLSHAQMTVLKANMKLHLKGLRLGVQVGDVSIWILMCLTLELASTNIKDDIITSPNIKDAQNIIQCFTEEERKQWDVGVRNGIQNNDWNELILHRMCFF